MKFLRICGVYEIRNLTNGNCYIGSAENIRTRWNRHISLLRAGKHHSQYLQSAWNKYGENAFSFFVLEQCGKEKLVSLEQEYINNRTPEYNMCPIAGSCLGIKRKIETRTKISKALTGIIRSKETRKKISESKRGIPSGRKGGTLGDKWRKKLSESHKGVSLSDTHRASLSRALKGRSSPMKGKTHSEESKRKISESMRIYRAIRKQDSQ